MKSEFADDIVIVVCGSKRAGQAGQRLFMDAASQAYQASGNQALIFKKITVVKCAYPDDERRNVVFLDISAIEERAQLKPLNKWLDATYTKKPPVAGILYLHQISDRLPVTNPRIFEELFGSDYPRYVVLVTTMWTKIAEADGLRREDELRKIYWKPMIDLGSDVIRYQDTAESAWRAVQLLLRTDAAIEHEGQPASAVSQPSAQTESQNSPVDVVVIAVMGPTGSGKTSFINLVTGRNDISGRDTPSSTTKVEVTRLHFPEKVDLDIMLVDTPGIDSAGNSDLQVITMVVDWLKETYNRNAKLDGVLYFHPISHGRVTDTSLKMPRMYDVVCGKDSLQNLVLVTTMWDEIEEKTGLEREKSLKERQWKDIINQGVSKIRQYRNTQDTAWTSVDHFVQIANHRYDILLQKEMADIKEKLRELTDDHASFFWRLETLVKKWQETMQKNRAQPKRRGEGLLNNVLQDESDDFQVQLAIIFTEMQMFDLHLGRALLGVFTPTYN